MKSWGFAISRTECLSLPAGNLVVQVSRDKVSNKERVRFLVIRMAGHCNILTSAQQNNITQLHNMYDLSLSGATEFLYFIKDETMLNIIKGAKLI